MGNYQTHTLSPVHAFEERGKCLNFQKRLNTIDEYKQYVHKKASGSGSLLELNIPETISLYESMDVSFNSLTELPYELPFRLPHLSHLDLSYNGLTSLPESIGLFIHLETLIIRHNFLQKIPASVAQLHKLSKVDLSHNHLIHVPEKFGDLKYLCKLNVSYNKLRELPLSLATCPSLTLLLATENLLETPPQSLCDKGSKPLLDYIKQKYRAIKEDSIPFEADRRFQRQRWNQLRTNVPNPHSPQMKYIQMQTHTTNVPSRLKTPLLLPNGSTKLDLQNVSDRISGMIYGAAIGDAIGLATRWMSPDECKFYYEKKDLIYSSILQDQHRVHWKPGDWTSNFDNMILVLDSLITWAGVVDELDFAKRLKHWSKHGFPDLGDTTGIITSFTMKKVLQQKVFERSPHTAAAAVLTLNSHNACENGDCGQQEFELNNGFVSPLDEIIDTDNAAVVRASILGVPHFYDLSEVASNAVRICWASHAHPECVSACIAITVLIALILQGHHDLNCPEAVDAMLNTAAHHAGPHLKTDEQKKEIKSILKINSLASLNVREKGRMCHTYKPLGSAVLALKTDKGYKEFISDLILEGGDSSSNACVAGALLGCRLGYQHLPTDWLNGLLSAQGDWLNVKVNSLLDMLGLP